MDQQYVYSINNTRPVNSPFMENTHSGDRLKHLLQMSGQTAVEFAFSMQISPQTLNNWFVRGIPGRQILTVAKALRVRPEWLESGDGFPLSDLEMEENKRISEMNAEELEGWMKEKNIGRTRRPSRVFSYPEISWSLAGCSLTVREQTDYDDRLRHSTDADAGDAAFWLTVKDSSMSSAVGVTFPEGYLILVSPDVEPKAGQFVLARITELNEATFKQLVIDAGDWYLKPINPAFPVKAYKDDWEIVGTVVDARIPSHLLNRSLISR